MVGTQAVELGAEVVQVRKVADPDRAAANLVFIGGADAAPGGADLARAGSRLAQPVQLAVEGEDQRAIVGHREVLGGDRNALTFEFFDLGLEVPRIEHHAVADNRQRAGDNAAGQQRELVDLFAHHQRMASVVAALKAHDGVGPAGQPVDDLALALIAPLGADYGDVGHCG